ncbi:MAG: indole-3-glycerol phosphate synthase TrpC [Bacteroidales bacterium]|nr:indole-3-glycerol phosphate synthase TrpC [Bacteroidales bacterium]
MTILEQIVADKRLEVAARKQAVPMEHVRKMAEGLKPGRSLKKALVESPTGIISEFKRKSPSKGYIHPDAQVVPVVMAYQNAGCCGVSVLTDEPYFGGTINDFKEARAVLDCPVLRKDFMIDPYQMYESKILGADVILLIAASLTLDEAYDLGELAHELGMEVLLEVHCEEELEYISRFTDMVGVNNRNLKVFKTDVQTSFDLVSKIPSNIVRISESGLSDPSTVNALRKVGYQGFLMGEAFMKEDKPGEALASFIKEMTQSDHL